MKNIFESVFVFTFMLSNFNVIHLNNICFINKLDMNVTSDKLVNVKCG